MHLIIKKCRLLTKKLERGLVLFQDVYFVADSFEDAKQKFRFAGSTPYCDQYICLKMMAGTSISNVNK